MSFWLSVAGGKAPDRLGCACRLNGSCVWAAIRVGGKSAGPEPGGRRRFGSDADPGAVGPLPARPERGPGLAAGPGEVGGNPTRFPPKAIRSKRRPGAAIPHPATPGPRARLTRGRPNLRGTRWRWSWRLRACTPGPISNGIRHFEALPGPHSCSIPAGTGASVLSDDRAYFHGGVSAGSLQVRENRPETEPQTPVVTSSGGPRKETAIVL